MLNVRGHKAILAAAVVAIALIGALSLLPAQSSTPASANPGAVENLAGCSTGALPAGDDSNSAQAPLGFSINYFGTTYSDLFVNNNGNVTFGSELGVYTPEPIGAGAGGRSIIAPFWADVDTFVGEVVHYGPVSYGGRNAFCVNWVDVGYFSDHIDKTNSFQLLIVDRGDVGAGDFDMYFNYDRVAWETGDASGGVNGFGGTSARMGYSNGSNVSFEYPGSAVPGAFLDSSATGLAHNSRDSTLQGRYKFAVRGGQPPVGGSISGRVLAENAAASANGAGGSAPLEGAIVGVCTDICTLTQTNSLGEYSVFGLPAGSYIVYAFPPAGPNLRPEQSDPVTLALGQDRTGVDVVLPRGLPKPSNTTLTPLLGTSGVVPMLNWAHSTGISETHAPNGGSIPWTVTKDGVVIASGVLLEDPAGSGIYKGTIPSLQPHHGWARVHKDTPDGPEDFDIWIDPSGVVRTVGGAPIEGATVTLYHSEAAAGPFAVAPNGSAIMSIVNRDNPDVTDSEGHFGWDVIPGFYKVRAEKAGCHAPDDPGQAFVETEVLTIPPAVTDLDLRLDCGAEPTPTPGSGVDIKWADADCSGGVGIGDAQKMARKLIGLSVSQTQPCPVIGSSLTVGDTVYMWADVDCSGMFSIGDAQKLSRFLIGLNVSQTDPCFGLDEVVTVHIPQ